jgi:uncharacterized protein
MKHSRRTFLQMSAATVAALQTGAVRAGESSANAAPQPPASPLQQFDYKDVSLLEGPLRTQFDQNHAFFAALDEDMLLKPFRQRARQPAPGDDMGGWYDNSADFDPHGSFHGFIPGHSFGQYVSALSRFYAATGDTQTRDKVRRLVRGFAPTVTPVFYDGYHLPAYTFDKTACGLIDAHQFAGDEMAFDVLGAATDAVLPHLPAKALARSEQYKLPYPDEAYCWDETYTLPENLFLAYKRGAGDRYRPLAVRFLEDDLYFGPLAEGQNVLPGEHAYSHVNALSSAMQAYLVTGSEKHLRAAKNGFGFLRDTQSFATGGWGPDELFRKPGSGEMGSSLKSSHFSFETPCGAYGHFKITRYLLRVTGDSRYGDSMERVLYNTVLGAKPMKEGGHAFYYSDYNNVFAKKGYYKDKWPCCSGTFPQVTADYGISSYFHDDSALYVNLYVPSRVTWSRSDARIVCTQQAEYPYRPATRLSFSLDKPSPFTLALRIPAWMGNGASIAVNGRRVSEAFQPGSFAHLDRTWQDGDVVEMEFAMSASLEAVDPEHPDVVAPIFGPLALFAVGAVPDGLRRSTLVEAARTAAENPAWQAQTERATLTLKPFPLIEDEIYRLYHPVET